MRPHLLHSIPPLTCKEVEMRDKRIASACLASPTAFLANMSCYIIGTGKCIADVCNASIHISIVSNFTCTETAGRAPMQLWNMRYHNFYKHLYHVSYIQCTMWGQLTFMYAGQVKVSVRVCFQIHNCVLYIQFVLLCRAFVQSIRDRNDLVKALTNVASWLLTSFVTVKLSEALAQSGSWVRRIFFVLYPMFQTNIWRRCWWLVLVCAINLQGALIANYMPSWPQDNNNVLLVLGLACLAVWAVKKFIL